MCTLPGSAVGQSARRSHDCLSGTDQGLVMNSNPEQFSLSEEIKRRKAQAVQREVEQRRLARLCGEKPPSETPAQKFVPIAAQPASRAPDSVIKPIPPRPPIQPLPPHLVIQD